MIYDAIVVGSGPAGAIAASTLASSGKSVLMADRQSFPRDKVCGDGLPARVLKMLQDLDIDIYKSNLKFHQIKALSIQAPSGHSLIVNEKPSLTFSMTSPRFNFDMMLHEHAIKVGAHFEVMDVQGPLFASRNGERHVVGIIEKKGKTTVEHEARTVIAADGASSAIARAVRGRVSEPQNTAIAIRAYGRLLKPMLPYVYFDFHYSLLPGYTWVFPVDADHVNIGIGLFDQEIYRNRGLNLKQLLVDFQKRLSAEFPVEIDPETIKSWPLPLWVSAESRIEKGIFLAGDAGRFIDALTGGGIYPAMLTGHLAAVHAGRLLAGDQNAYMDYDSAWRKGLGRSLRQANFVQNYIASKQRVFNSIFAIARLNPVLKSTLLDMLAGEHS